MSGEIWAREEPARLSDFITPAYWEKKYIFHPDFISKIHACVIGCDCSDGMSLCGQVFSTKSTPRDDIKKIANGAHTWPRNGLYFFNRLENVKEIDCKRCLSILSKRGESIQ